MIEMTDRAFGPHGPVLVTGGNGYIGSWLVKRLLELGHDVHATVRDLTDPKETLHLEAIATDLPGSLSLYGAELLD
ncbi:MAG: NAD-dependent epimerase/dehydratase family protein, partial [Candidatus Dadabacteria bacterium]|nr:NAD-dependent epimerase/dehydratase family protein [Candidatus Dadabacteria bacterium]